MTKTKSLLFYLVFFLLSLVVSLVVVELLLSAFNYSTGDGGGKAARRWAELHWHPINKEGFRDFEWQTAPVHPALLFLGDSFTEGHGVDFKETYYYRARAALPGFTSYSLGRSGSSTRDEQTTYDAFRKQTNIRPDTVVYQYFGNDLQELVPEPPKWQPWPGLEFLSKHSEIADLIWTYMESSYEGKPYADLYLGSYNNPAVYKAHQADLQRLVATIHGDQARLVMIVFPFLDNEEYIRRSQAGYVDKLRQVFKSNCGPRDLFLDVTPLAKKFNDKDRIVNRLDSHPSPQLHALIAAELVQVLTHSADDAAAAATLPEGFETCQ